jgi:hypothetical protein
MKFKTPEELARLQGKDKFTLYLDIEAMTYIRQRARKAGTSTSKIVNEAILAYLAVIKNGNKKD